MEKVLMIGIIALPIVMFLAFFGDDIMQTFQDRAGNTASQGDSLESTAGSSGWN